jgi:GH18 family chitinase
MPDQAGALKRTPLPGLLIASVLVSGLLLPLKGVAWGADRSDPAFRIIGYLPEYRLAQFDSRTAAPLTDLILFAAEPAADGTLDLKRLANAPWGELRDFRKQHGAKLHLCVGGWGRSDHFARVALDETLRTRFVESTASFLRQQQLNGLDLDWEHPGNDAERQGYTNLLRDLKAAFRPHGLEVSLTMAPWQQLPDEAYQLADRVQLMCYDYGQRHSTLEHAKADVRSFIKRKIPRGKLVLGLPFYGRKIDDRSRTITWRDVAARYDLPPGADEVDGFFFNGPETIRLKTGIALDARLGGVMIWEVGQDASGEKSLIKVIAKEVARRTN